MKIKKISKISSVAVTLLVVGMWIVITIGLVTKSLSGGEEYAQTAVVTEIDYVNDVVVCEDYNGFTWEFMGTDDWLPGDCVSLIMNDNGTQSVTDDKIVSVKYSGWIIHR